MQAHENPSDVQAAAKARIEPRLSIDKVAAELGVNDRKRYAAVFEDLNDPTVMDAAWR